MKKECRRGNWEEKDFLEQTTEMKKIMLVNHLHRKKIEKLVDGTGLHRAQHRMLMTLSGNEFRSQADLAKELEVSTATVAVSLKKLERDGYITKEVKKEDTRINFVNLTEKGKKVVEGSRRIFGYMDDQALLGFSAEEKQIFGKYLWRVYSNLSEIEAKCE